MEINRCINCENEIESYPCPHCGFDRSSYQQPEYALPCDTVLHGRYLVGKVLGQGGFGITYVGWDLALEVKVAVKEYYPNGQVTRSTTNTSLNWYTNAQAVSLRQNGMETFLKEARKMAKVEKIPEVVRVRDTFVENETAYIVMDFVDGETLKSRLERKGPLGWEDAKKIFFPAITAMEKVHQIGIVHRDLSPDNLMLLPDGDVSILDLGAAKDLSAGSGLSSALVAKAGFSPIEQYTERGGSGPWTDVYAMAATMYYALTGRLPASATDRLNAVFNQEPDPMKWDIPRLKIIPANVIEALQNALKTAHRDRTQSMAEFLKQLTEKKPQKAPEKKPQPNDTPVKTTPPAVSWDAFKAENQSAPKDPRSVPSAIKTPEPAVQGTMPTTPAVKSAKGFRPLGAVVAVVLICICFYSFIHIWEPATCTSPETCSICGKTRGKALPHSWVAATCAEAKHCSVCGKTEGSAKGHKWVQATCTKAKYCSVCGKTEGGVLDHKWIAATCTEAKHCSVCGKKEGTALGHDWREATYTTPKTCRRCGKTEGTTKGYIEKLSYHWGERTTVQWNTGNPMVLDQTINNCTQMTLNFQITSVISGNVYGKWALYGKNLQGKWQRLSYFEVPDGNKVKEVIKFDKPVSFTELFVLKTTNSGGSWYDNWSITDVYLSN